MGFDGIDLTAFYIPSITTVAQPIKEMAIETSRLLFEVIDGKEHRHPVFEANIVERETT
jgi:LacI family transcriptional regulator